MNSLSLLIVLIVLLKGLELAIPRRRRSYRHRRSGGPEGENIGALLWEGLCHAIEEKAPWVFPLLNALFWVLIVVAGYLIWKHWG